MHDLAGFGHQKTRLYANRPRPGRWCRRYNAAMRPPPPVKDFQRYPVVSGTILLAIVATLAWWSNKNVDFLLADGGIRRWQLWRLITSALLHANMLHLVFDLYWTWVFGTLVEQRFGSLRTLALFAWLAIVSSGTQYALAEGGVGLSGVAYGLFGLLWVLSRRDPRFADVIDERTIALFVAWFFFCIFLTYAGYPIGNVAHAAGAAAGAALGWAVTARRPARLLAATANALLLIGAVLGAVVFRPWINFSPQAAYDEGRLGYDALIANDNQQAVHWLTDATRMNPDEANFWCNLAIAQSRLNHPTEAEIDMAKAGQLNPKYQTHQPAGKD